MLWRMANGHYLIVEAKDEIDPSRREIYKSEAQQLGHHVTWFEQEYPGEACTPILVHPSATLAHDAYLSEKARIMQQEDVAKIANSVRSFVAALASKPCAEWSVIEIATLLESYKLRPTDLLGEQLVGRRPHRK